MLSFVKTITGLEDPEQRAVHFMKIWTLKEAYVKAVGRGISAPPGLKGFSFHLPPSVALAAPSIVEFSAQHPLEDQAKTWEFALIHPSESHVAAVCCERPSNGVPLRLHSFEVSWPHGRVALAQDHLMIAHSPDGWMPLISTEE